jgi:hypothetical protein
LATAIETTLPAPAAAGRQPTEVSTFHRDGQTFVTWREIADLFPGPVTFAAHAEIRKQNAHISYHVYRYTAPITSANLARTTLVGRVGVGSGYNANLYGMEGRHSQEALKRFVIAEDKGSTRAMRWGRTPDSTFTPSRPTMSVSTTTP